MKILENIAKKYAEMTVATNINTACCLYAYQPKLPQGADRFKKIK